MKRKLLPLLALCLALLLTAACSAQRSESAASYDMDAPAEAVSANWMVAEESGYGAPAAAPKSSADNSSAQTAAPSDADVRKIIYNASLSLTADDPSAALQAIVDKALALGGYVGNSYSTNDDDGVTNCSATLKVPAEKLDELVHVAKSAGSVNDYRLYSDDISMQYYDIRARLNNAKAEEKQLVEILGQCKTIEEVLAVRESLTAVRSDIESYQAQINLWDNLVGYATLDLSIRRTPKTLESSEGELLAIWKASDVWQDMTRGFQNSIRFLVNAVSAIGIFLAIAIIPLSVLFLCIGLPIILHHRKKKRIAAQAAQAVAAQAEAKPADTPAQVTPADAQAETDPADGGDNSAQAQRDGKA